MPDKFSILSKAQEIKRADMLATIVKAYVQHRQQGVTCGVITSSAAVTAFNAGIRQGLRQAGLLGKEHCVKQLVVKGNLSHEVGDYVYYPNPSYRDRGNEYKEPSHLYYKIMEVNRRTLTLSDERNAKPVFLTVDRQHAYLNHRPAYVLEERTLFEGERIQIPLLKETTGGITGKVEIVTFLGAAKAGEMHVASSEDGEKIISVHQAMWESAYALPFKHSIVGGKVEQVLVVDFGDGDIFRNEPPDYAVSPRRSLLEESFSLGLRGATLYATNKALFEEEAAYRKKLGYAESSSRVEVDEASCIKSEAYAGIYSAHEKAHNKYLTEMSEELAAYGICNNPTKGEVFDLEPELYEAYLNELEAVNEYDAYGL